MNNMLPLVFSLFPAFIPAFAEGFRPADAPKARSGATDAPFTRHITTADELDAVRNDLAGTYSLDADIDLADRDWTPIGNDSERFTGTFLGNGHAVRNMVCTNNPSGNSYRGLFGCTGGATIESVSVSGTVAGNSYVGGLVGRAGDGTVIRNCSATVEVTALASYAGGLAGACESGDAVNAFTGCRADGFVDGNGFIGGLIGYIYAPTTISNCVARGDVRSSGSDYGGFVGQIAHASATIDDCWSAGAVWGTGGNIGSFVGNLRSGTITNCAVSAYANGFRLFCGNDTDITGDRLSQADIKARSAGWPSAPKRARSDALTPIASAEELLAITNNLAGRYVLTADIDFGGETIAPIGGYTAAFTGEFYGQNHRIFDFAVDTTERYAGFFGKIAGGRVSGVQMEGTVIGAYTGTGTDVGVGGFAGKIDSKSLIDGCSFDGEVENQETCNAGGFVGYTADSPVILRCCVHGFVAKPSNKPNAGGFVGSHAGGAIMDCYAIADVEADSNSIGGFAGFVSSSARIATSWCSSHVDATGSYRGAFAGDANGNGLVTQSYYDTSANGSMQATGTRRMNDSAVYDGISPLTNDDMLHKASFVGFDFDGTWLIDEGETTPYLRLKSAYALWLEVNGLSEDTDPAAVTDGVPYGIRYLFDRPTGFFKPFTGIAFDGKGHVILSMLPLVNDEEVTVKVIASPSLTDWSQAEEAVITITTDGTIRFDHAGAPARFYRLEAQFDH